MGKKVRSRFKPIVDQSSWNFWTIYCPKISWTLVVGHPSYFPVQESFIKVLFLSYTFRIGHPSYFPVPLPDCLCHDSFSRYSPLSVEVVENWTNVKVSWPHFSWGTTPIVLQQIVSAIYHPPFGEVWLSSVCWSPSAKPGNEAKCRIYGGWVKCRSNF